MEVIFPITGERTPVAKMLRPLAMSGSRMNITFILAVFGWPVHRCLPDHLVVFPRAFDNALVVGVALPYTLATPVTLIVYEVAFIYIA